MVARLTKIGSQRFAHHELHAYIAGAIPAVFLLPAHFFRQYCSRLIFVGGPITQTPTLPAPLLQSPSRVPFPPPVATPRPSTCAPPPISLPCPVATPRPPTIDKTCIVIESPSISMNLHLFRGHTPPTETELVKSVEEIMAQHGLRRATFFGHSFGSISVAWMSRRRPHVSHDLEFVAHEAAPGRGGEGIPNLLKFRVMFAR